MHYFFLGHPVSLPSHYSISWLSNDSLMLEEDKIRWVTYDGRKPLDDDLKCGILSSLAIYLDNKCQVSELCI